MAPSSHSPMLPPPPKPSSSWTTSDLFAALSQYPEIARTVVEFWEGEPKLKLDLESSLAAVHAVLEPVPGCLIPDATYRQSHLNLILDENSPPFQGIVDGLRSTITERLDYLKSDNSIFALLQTLSFISGAVDAAQAVLHGEDFSRIMLGPLQQLFDFITHHPGNTYDFRSTEPALTIHDAFGEAMSVCNAGMGRVLQNQVMELLEEIVQALGGYQFFELTLYLVSHHDDPFAIWNLPWESHGPSATPPNPARITHRDCIDNPEWRDELERIEWEWERDDEGQEHGYGWTT